LATFFQGSEGSCLEITPKSASLSGHAPGIDETLAEQQTSQRHAAWGMRSTLQGNNVTKSPPITRQYARSVGEFLVSLPLARRRNE
jgi:hypothetical protein